MQFHPAFLTEKCRTRKPAANIPIVRLRPTRNHGTLLGV
jgi:hypothetical protein